MHLLCMMTVLELQAARVTLFSLHLSEVCECRKVLARICCLLFAVCCLYGNLHFCPTA